jgi:hypothetical protein
LLHLLKQTAEDLHGGIGLMNANEAVPRRKTKQDRQAGF